DLQRRRREGRVQAAAAALRPPLAARALDRRPACGCGALHGPGRRRARGAVADRAPARVSADPLRATYRLQLGQHLSLARARSLVPYLRELGISHLYLSPVLQARRGTTHGYDVTDPRRVHDELGGEGDLRALCQAGLGVVLDVVPNHMAAEGDEN